MKGLRELALRTINGFRAALADMEITAPFFISQDDGTLLSADLAFDYPVLTFAQRAQGRDCDRRGRNNDRHRGTPKWISREQFFLFSLRHLELIEALFKLVAERLPLAFSDVEMLVRFLHRTSGVDLRTAGSLAY